MMQGLFDALGPNGVITDLAAMAPYLDDPLGYKAAPPRLVLRPASTSEVQLALRWCQAKGLSVAPQGGLSGLVSGAVPGSDGEIAILSIGRMNKIRAFDTAGNTITVEAGAILADVRTAAESQDRYFPLIHGGAGSSQIGGNLATNAGGNNALRYGTARDQVLGLEVVLPDGTLWDGLRALRKNTAGYDLRQIFIGSEGTLGVITAAVLKLRAFPKNRATAFVAVDSPAKSLDLLHALECHLGETIAAFELMSDAALQFALSAEGARYPLAATAPWAVLIEAETAALGFNLGQALETGLAEAMETGQVLDAVIAQNEAQRRDFWHLRESIATVMIEDKSCLKSDAAVPVSQVPAFLRNAGRAVLAHLPGTRLTPFGHLGDGNVHFNLVRPVGMAPDAFRARWHDLTMVIATEALNLGGTISAEHGIGRLKRAEFLKVSDSVSLELMRKIKQSFDPAARMNPGIVLG